MHYTNLFTSDSGTKTGFFFLGLSVVCSLGKSCPHNRKDVFNSILSWVLWFLWAIGLCSKNSPGTGTGKGMGRPKFCPRRPPWDLALGSSMPLTGLARPGAGWKRDLTGSASQAVRRGKRWWGWNVMPMKGTPGFLQDQLAAQGRLWIPRSYFVWNQETMSSAPLGL